MRKKVAVLSMYIALGIIFSYLELLIPFHIGIPGVKLGLANIVVLLALYQLGEKEALTISLLRVLLVGLMFGNLFIILYSMAGCCLSFLVMKILYKSKQISVIGVSMAGAVSHNVGQLVVAMLVMESLNLLYYFSVLLIAGLITGAVTGVIVKETKKRLKFTLFFLLLMITGCGSSTEEIEPSAEEQTTFFAMNTVMNVKLGEENQELLSEIEDTVVDLEKELSVTDSNSAIYILNKEKKSVLPDEALNVLEYAIELAKLTEGNYDPTIYPIVKLWGFTTDDYKVPKQAEIEELLYYVNFSHVNIQGSEVTLEGNAEVDFGGVAKGYVSDLIVEEIEKAEVESALIELGGNVYAHGKKADGSKWTIGVKSPVKGDVLGALQIEDKAVVTSGGYERYFEGEDEEIYWHIMNPMTGHPAKNELQSVTIVSDSGAYADGLSTALFVMGKEKAIQFWENHKDFDVILVTEEDVYITEGIKSTFALESEYNHMRLTVIDK